MRTRAQKARDVMESCSDHMMDFPGVNSIVGPYARVHQMNTFTMTMKIDYIFDLEEFLDLSKYDAERLARRQCYAVLSNIMDELKALGG